MQSKGGAMHKPVYLRSDIHQGLHRAYSNSEYRSLYLSQFTPVQKKRALFLLKALEYEIGKKEIHKIMLEVPVIQYNKLKILAGEKGLTPTKLLESIVNNI